MPRWVASSSDAYSVQVVDIPFGGGVLAPLGPPLPGDGGGNNGVDGDAVRVGVRFVVVVVDMPV